MSEVTDRITSLIAGFDARVQAAAPGSWTNQSPCAEWKARDVVEHVANNMLRLASAMTGTEQAPMAADESAPAGWGRAKAAFLGALPTADMSTKVPGPMGEMPLEQFLGRLMSTDVLVHTWDLARAVGGDEKLPEDVVAGAYSGLKPLDGMIRMPGVFGAKLDAPAGADLQTEFLSFLGRKV